MPDIAVIVVAAVVAIPEVFPRDVHKIPVDLYDRHLPAPPTIATLRGHGCANMPR